MRVRAALRRRVQLARNLVPEEVHERTGDGRHASADDADVAFDGTPQAGVVVVIGRVCVSSDLGQVLQADDAADRHEQANKEGHDDADFAPRVGNLQLDKPGNREEKDNKIEGDVDSATDVGSESEVDAGAFVFTIPLYPEAVSPKKKYSD